jgi:hypothetical protein
MDRALLIQNLAEAERHVAEGERHLAEQEARIIALEHRGHDTEEAVTILETLKQSQVLHLASRDRILKQLKA